VTAQGDGAVLVDGVERSLPYRQSFAPGTSVSLEAVASTGAEFDGWTGSIATARNPLSIVMDVPSDLTAVFVSREETRSITVQRTGAGSGEVSSEPAGIACGDACRASFAKNALVTLTAEAGALSTFERWTGCDATDGSTCTIEGDDDRTIDAEFATAVPTSSNDDFVDAIALTGATGTAYADNAGASKEAGEPNHGGDSGGSSLWWTWTAPTGGPVTFDARGSAIDVVAAVYTGSAVDDLDEVGTPGFLVAAAASVTVDALEGATYHVAVDGVGGATGDIRLDWSPTATEGEVSWALDPAQLSFIGTRGGPAPDDQVTRLSNIGADAGAFDARDDRSWLDVSPVFGDLDAGATTQLTVSVDGCTDTGTSTGTVTIDGHDVTATLSVERTCDGADWRTSPPELAFQGSVGEPAPLDESVRLENAGTIAADYTVTSDRAWLTVSPGDGTLGVGDDEALTVGVDACDSEGTASGTLTIEGGGHARTVPVTRSCTDPSGEPPVTLSIDRIYINQSVPAQDTNVASAARVALVANRGGLLRVFATADDPGTGQATVTLHYRYDGASENTLSLDGPTSVPLGTLESSRASVYERLLTSDVVQPGLEAYVIVEAVADGTPVSARYPSSGYWTLDVETVPPVNMTIVPVTYAGGTPSVGDGSAYLSFTERLFPMGEDTVDVQVRSPYAFGGDLSTADGWLRLLNEVTTLRQSDDTSRHYYGVVDPNYSSGIAGIGWIGKGPSSPPVAAGWSRLPSGSEVAAHELGHNWGRAHAPCGVSDGDPSYPYGGAGIGTWGYDLLSDALRSPDAYVDLMSYCSPTWVSDYTYEGVMDYRRTASYTVETSSAPQRLLVVSGSVGPDGLDLEPLLTLTGRPANVAEGPYTLIVWASDDRRVLEVPFDTRRVSVHPYDAFHLSLPLPDDVVSISRVRIERDGSVLVDRSARRVKTAAEPPVVRRLPGGALAVEWDAAAYRSAVVRDGVDGPLLGRDSTGRLVVRPSGATVEVLLGDGVATDRYILSD
jgi:hypothetical protein